MPTAEPFATENMAVVEYILGQARIEFTRAEGQSLACRTQSLDKVSAELGAKPANHSQIKRGTAAACTARRGMQGHEVGEISLWLVDERQRSARGGIHLWRQAGRIVPFRELGAKKAAATGRREFCLQACSGCDRWIMA